MIPSKMRHFRNLFFLRFTASLTLLSVGSMLFVPAVRADSSGDGYANRLKLYLPGGLMPQVQSALDRATETGPRSFDEFLQAFLIEIASEDSERSIGEKIIGEDVEDDAVIQELRRHFNGLVGTGVLFRQIQATSSAGTDCLKKRPVRDNTLLSGRTQNAPDRVFNRTLTSLAHSISCGLLRSSAQPLGP